MGSGSEVDPIDQKLFLCDLQSHLQGPDFESLLEKTDEYVQETAYCTGFMSNMFGIIPIVTVREVGTNTICPFKIISVTYSGFMSSRGNGEITPKNYDVEIASELAGLILPVTAKIEPAEDEIKAVSKYIDNLKVAREMNLLPDLHDSLSYIAIPQPVS